MNTELTYLSKHEIIVDKYDYECLLDELKSLRKLKKSLPDSKKLTDTAYKIATKTLTERQMTLNQWNKCNIDKVTIVPMLWLDQECTTDFVNAIAQDIIESFEYLEKDNI